MKPAMASVPPLSSTEALYRRWVGPLLARDDGADAEQLTQLTLTALGLASRRRHWPLVSGSLAGLGAELQRPDLRLEQTLFGCRFSNPVGLAAGFDKNAVAAGIWHLFGFGSAELGTITWHGQPGNPRPRLFRLSQEQAALNRMGFNNNGAVAAKRTLEEQQLPPAGQRPAVLGLNLGKSRITTLERAPDDYASTLELLAPLADYAVINVSSPNTPGLRDLQDATQLRRLVERLRRLPGCPPLLVKIAPDLEDDAIDTIARLAYQEGRREHQLEPSGAGEPPARPDRPHPPGGGRWPQRCSAAGPGAGGVAPAAGHGRSGPAVGGGGRHRLAAIRLGAHHGGSVLDPAVHRLDLQRPRPGAHHSRRPPAATRPSRLPPHHRSRGQWFAFLAHLTS
jgi:hypothetical protein